MREQRLGRLLQARDHLGAVRLRDRARRVPPERAVVRGHDRGDGRLAGVERGRVRDVGAEDDEGAAADDGDDEVGVARQLFFFVWFVCFVGGVVFFVDCVFA